MASCDALLDEPRQIGQARTSSRRRGLPAAASLEHVARGLHRRAQLRGRLASRIGSRRQPIDASAGSRDPTSSLEATVSDSMAAELIASERGRLILGLAPVARCGGALRRDGLRVASRSVSPRCTISSLRWSASASTTKSTIQHTGDALQQTTNGLLVWRKSDNWTAFTDGSQSWVNGPLGLQQRQNDQRFWWEANPDGWQIVPRARAGERCHTAGPGPGAGRASTRAPATWSARSASPTRSDVSCTFFGYPGGAIARRRRQSGADESRARRRLLHQQSAAQHASTCRPHDAAHVPHPLGAGARRQRNNLLDGQPAWP